MNSHYQRVKKLLSETVKEATTSNISETDLEEAGVKVPIATAIKINPAALGKMAATADVTITDAVNPNELNQKEKNLVMSKFNSFLKLKKSQLWECEPYDIVDFIAQALPQQLKNKKKEVKDYLTLRLFTPDNDELDEDQNNRTTKEQFIAKKAFALTREDQAKYKLADLTPEEALEELRFVKDEDINYLYNKLKTGTTIDMGVQMNEFFDPEEQQAYSDYNVWEKAAKEVGAVSFKNIPGDYTSRLAYNTENEEVGNWDEMMNTGVIYDEPQTTHDTHA